MFRPAGRSIRLVPRLPAPTRLLSSSARPRALPTAFAIGAGALTVITTLYTVAVQREPLSLDSVPLTASPPAGVGQPVSADEVRAHNAKESAWVVIDGTVYDITLFLEKHPGGAEVIIEHLGKDISPIFNLLHAKGVLERTVEELVVIGTIVPGSGLEVVPTSVNADEVDARRKALRGLETVKNLAEFEILAKEVLGDTRAWHFFSSFADDGASFYEARSSFSHLRFVPRVNIPVSETSTTTTFLNSSTPVSLPILYCPIGQMANGHPDGELNLTRAAGVKGVPHIISTMASISFPELAAERDSRQEAGKGRATLWWQLYVMTDRKESERRILEAVRGGALAVLITVDAPEIGNREADSKPPSYNMMDSNLTWDDIAWVKRVVKDVAPTLPILVKGVGCVQDVELAKRYGAAGVVLSNHGGRQLDFSPPPLATLVRLRETKPELLEDPDFDVFIDGGVHRGTDVLKALCLGAKGVGLGRVMCYAQTCYGEAGVIRATEILQKEIRSGMRLLGARSIQELRPEMLELMDGLVGKQLGKRE